MVVIDLENDNKEKIADALLCKTFQSWRFELGLIDWSRCNESDEALNGIAFVMQYSCSVGAGSSN